jgi:uracil-DNA glycosylase family 4
VSYQPKPSACEGCPAEHKGLGYVPGTGSWESGVAFLAQGPGFDEAMGIDGHYEPFIGRSGQVHNERIGRAGLARSQVYLDNTVRCFLVRRTKTGAVIYKKSGTPQDREPSMVEQRECWRRHVGSPLREAAAQGGLRVLVAVGVPASRFLLGSWFRAGAVGSIESIELPEVTP